MSIKFGGLFTPAGNSSSQIFGGAAVTKPLAANQPTPEGYTGKTLPVKIEATDSQETFVHRGFYEHAKKAGLKDSEATEFADKWTNKQTSFNHRANGSSTPFTEAEFENLKTKSTADFDLSQEYDAAILADLNERVGEPIIAETNPAYLPPGDKAAMLEAKNPSANQAAIVEKPILTMIDGKTSDGQPINAETALTRYIQETYNPITESGSRRVWGDKINEMIAAAGTDGIKVELTFNDDGTALVGVNAADKQKLDRLFHQAMAKTILGEEGSLKAGKEELGQVVDIPIMAANGVISGVNGISEPVRGILATVGVDASGGELPKVPYQSEYGQKNGRAGEIGTEIGIGILTAPLAVKTLAGKIIAGGTGAYNVAVGWEGHDPTRPDAQGRGREMDVLERGGRVLGGAAGIIGARPSFSKAGQSGKVLAQESEVVEMLGTNGQTVRVQMPKSAQTASETATARPVQTAEDLNTKIVSVDSHGNPSGTRFRSDYEDHISQREFSKASQKTGVNGGHEMAEFEQYAIKPGATQTKESVNIVSKTPHPTVKGVYKIEYQMPKLDTKGQATGLWRNRTGAEPFVKTVYDPAVISKEQMTQWGREAFADAVNKGFKGQTRDWEGLAPNGIKFKGYIDDNGTGAVRTLFIDF